MKSNLFFGYDIQHSKFIIVLLNLDLIKVQVYVQSAAADKKDV